jgi:hypothetical protein
LQHVKYYFPDYKIPGFITYLSTLDGPGIALTKNYIAIGMHQYAGKNFGAYFEEEVQRLYPFYISRRFDEEYMAANCMKAIVNDLFPDKTGGKPLIEQMIEKGKQWYLLDLFIPDAADSVKTFYTQKQLDWCERNEVISGPLFLKMKFEFHQPDSNSNLYYEGLLKVSRKLPAIYM